MASRTTPTTRRGPIWRRLASLFGAILAVTAIGMVADGWKAFGKRATGARRSRMEHSPQWKDDQFRNPQPLWNDMFGALVGAFRASPYGSPANPIPTNRVEKNQFDTPPGSGLRVTWLGHSTLLIEIDGHRVLTDPVWSDRISPYSWIGPRRWYPPLIALADLPPLDAVVISHDHYDHLDYATISAMKDLKTPFVVPLGVGAHLAYWGVADERIVELDWWERARVGDLTIVATPARHASGRTAMFGQDGTLWAGFALVGVKHRAWYSGDTGMFPGLRDIGERLGPFDVTMIEVGAYGRWWPDWHLGPEQAVEAHQRVRGRTMIPTHWGLFNLAYHGWTEPIERLLVATAQTGTTITVPKPGSSVEPDAATGTVERWWPEVPWLTANQNPIVATGLD